MAGLLEIAADKDQAGRIGAEIAASKDQAEELVGALYGLGIEGRAARAQQVVVALEEAEGMRAALESKLEAAQQQVLSAANGNAGSGAGTSATSEASPDTGGAGGGSDKPPPNEPPTSAAPGGDPEDDSPKGNESGPGDGDALDGPYQNVVGEPLEPLPELDLDDDQGSKVGQVGRNMFRSMGDYADAGKSFGQNAQSLLHDGYQPFGRGGQAQTETVKDTGNNPVFTADPKSVHIDAGDFFGNAMFGVATALWGIGWVLDRRGRRRHDGAK